MTQRAKCKIKPFVAICVAFIVSVLLHHHGEATREPNGHHPYNKDLVNTGVSCIGCNEHMLGGTFHFDQCGE